MVHVNFMNIRKILSIVFAALFFLLPDFLFSNEIYIKDIVFEITGFTKQYALEQKLHQKINYSRNMEFKSELALQSFIEEFRQQLNNLRVFEQIEITTESDSSFEQIEVTAESDSSSEQIERSAKSDSSSEHIILHVKLKDSFHLLAIPHVLSYNSNDGWKPKLKAKDTNFLGTLNTMSTDIFAVIPLDESDNRTTKFGTTFSFDYPFKMNVFDSVWINDYTLSYASGQQSPEWNLKTGLKLSLPRNAFSYDFEFYQLAVRNFNYKPYDDDTYFNEQFQFSVPFIAGKHNYFGNINIKPYIDLSFNWDYNGINPDNTDLSSPKITAGVTASMGRTDWNDNFRKGITTTVSNYYSYNMQRNILYPVITMEAAAYWNHQLGDFKLFNKFGITSRFYGFINIVDTQNPYISKDGMFIGSRLRGIRDEQLYEGSGSLKACQTISAFVLNVDFPVRVFTTDFQKRIINYFNFDFQISPFIDIALTHNKITGRWYDYKDGFYAAGIEVLVYPKKWSSFTVRGSAGCDIGRLLFKNNIDYSWRSDISPFEISIGIGLQY